MKDKKKDWICNSCGKEANFKEGKTSTDKMVNWCNECYGKMLTEKGLRGK